MKGKFKVGDRVSIRKDIEEHMEACRAPMWLREEYRRLINNKCTIGRVRETRWLGDSGFDGDVVYFLEDATKVPESILVSYSPIRYRKEEK